MIRLWVGLLIFCGLPSPLLAQPAAFPSTSDYDTPAGSQVDGPVLPERQQHWPGAMVIAIAGVFLAAAVIGPIVRANTPAEIEEFTPPREVHQPERP